ncbi:hypothetical protein THIOM_002098 [Candidatus Thiomargarita nelsonii]|uniref:Uncharacterized protein n=1 Tax=Candidatus Thiomargarita nelsonii TaxID=1003181 RepID=A0A176S2E3_9GAMM|nr:hypothetical protein THIOM_002098 [Candidatus Thiomargarita nelsonii]
MWAVMPVTIEPVFSMACLSLLVKIPLIPKWIPISLLMSRNIGKQRASIISTMGILSSAWANMF